MRLYPENNRCKARNGASVTRWLSGGKQLLAPIPGVDSMGFCQVGTQLLLQNRGNSYVIFSFLRETCTVQYFTCVYALAALSAIVCTGVCSLGGSVRC
jgi:hypothetical protein